MQVVDLYSGAGGMALGLMLSQYIVDTLRLVPVTKSKGKTLAVNYAKNRESVTVLNSVKSVRTPADLLTATLNNSDLNRAEFQTGHTPQETMRELLEVLHCVHATNPRWVVIETTEGFKNADSGALYSYWTRSIRGLNYNTRCCNFKSYGCAFKKERVYLVAWRYGQDMMLKYTGNRFLTLGEVLDNVPSSTGSKFTPATAAKFAEVQPGDSYRRGEYRRLSWHQTAPEPTLKSGKNALCHPDELRPLTVAEVKRLLGYPDTYYIDGNMKEQYRQLMQTPAPAMIREFFNHLVLL